MKVDKDGKPTDIRVESADEVGHLTNSQIIEDEIAKGNYMYIKE